MKRRVVAGLLASAMVLSLAACGSKDSGSAAPAGGNGETKAATSEGEVVLTFPTYWVGENVGAVYFEPAVERFNEKYAGQYRVELEEVVEDTYTEKMSQLAQSKKLPVLIQSTTQEFVDTVLVPNKMYYPMNEFLDAHPEVKDLCVDSSVEFCTKENGDIVTMPIVTLSNVGLFYNSALYAPEKPVSSMSVDEFLTSFGDNKIAFQTVDNAWTSMLFLTSLIANEEGGTQLLQENDGLILTDFNQTPIINAVTKFKAIWDSNAAASSMGAAYADAANTFLSSQAALIANGSWMNSEFAADSATKWSGDFNGETIKADYYPGNVAICNTKAYGRYILTNNGTEEERKCAEEFLAFIFSPEELEQFALVEGCQIPNLKLSDDFMQKLSADPLIKDQTALITEDTTFVPSLASIMVSSVANDVFANDLVQLVNGTITPEQFCNDLTVKSEEASE